MKKWEIQNKLRVENGELRIDDIVELLLENRGITTEEDRKSFLHPKLEDVTPKNVGIDLKQLKKALQRITKAIEAKEQIIVFGDYDVDGITGSAILWETLYAMKAKVIPYIPHRVDEGYGLSVKGIQNVIEKTPRLAALARGDKGGLIITVDNGIVANEAVDFANAQGIDVIITDHHTVGEKLPDAHAVVHTTKLCGAGVAYLLAQELKGGPFDSAQDKNGTLRENDIHLELAALGTVADLVPSIGANRTIVKYGLEKLAKTKRPGLLHLFKQAKLEKDVFTTYDIGFIIAPRLNAAGRIESAMDSLRLLCTNSFDRAEMLAEQLELTNRERQLIMKASTEHATEKVKSQNSKVKNLLFVADESYPQGVIGLVAGKLVEEFYRPSIVISIGETHSKASVRSINGFNIIEFLRGSFDDFVNIGGHPMAAGFTVETAKLQLLQERLEQLADGALDDGMLIRSIKVDCELPLASITPELYATLQQLAPFGMANPEPTFVSRGAVVKDMRLLGAEKNHLKLVLQQQATSNKQQGNVFEAIAFKMGGLAEQIAIGDAIDVVYTVDENTWNGNTKLQLKVKDIHPLSS